MASSRCTRKAGEHVAALTGPDRVNRRRRQERIDLDPLGRGQRQVAQLAVADRDDAIAADLVALADLPLRGLAVLQLADLLAADPSHVGQMVLMEVDTVVLSRGSDMDGHGDQAGRAWSWAAA